MLRLRLEEEEGAASGRGGVRFSGEEGGGVP